MIYRRESTLATNGMALLLDLFILLAVTAKHCGKAVCGFVLGRYEDLSRPISYARDTESLQLAYLESGPLALLDLLGTLAALAQTGRPALFSREGFGTAVE